MSVVLLSAEKKQYKANLHCHSTRSDGRLSPAELKALYRAQGYHILAITDHCNPCDHSALSEEDFLLLTGYEAYIRPDPAGRYDVFSPEIHMNLFAKDPGNVALVCYNPHYTKYIPREQHGSLLRVGSEEPRAYTVDYINRFIRTANENGYLVVYNHPFWSMESEERILSYEGLQSLEMYNTSAHVLNNLENGEMLYDLMMRRGIRIGAHAGDDNHNHHPFDSPYNDSCGWYTAILADALTYGDVITALKRRDFYATNGPAIHEIRLEDGKEGKEVHVTCSPAASVYLYYGSKTPKACRLAAGETGTEFILPLHPEAAYFRISVTDAEGRRANSRGFFREEWES